MGMILAKVLDCDTATCPYCKVTYDAWDLEVGTDWFFEWDNWDVLTGEKLRDEPIYEDCCFNCVDKAKKEHKLFYERK